MSIILNIIKLDGSVFKISTIELSLSILILEVSTQIDLVNPTETKPFL